MQRPENLVELAALAGMARRALLVLAALGFVSTAPPSLTAQPSVERVAGDLAFPPTWPPPWMGGSSSPKGDGQRPDHPGRPGAPEPFVHVSVEVSAERRLLGTALHPDFEREPWVYLYYSERGGASNRIIRVRAEGDRAAAVIPSSRCFPP